MKAERDEGNCKPQPDLAVFVEALERATRKVSKDYFQLPVAGSETPVYRERVYCYELYHHLRKALPADFNYSLCGEVDKSGHPVIHDPPLNYRKPDFLVHSAGKMDKNLIAVEVKPVTAQKRGLAKDIETLLSCLDQANYKYGMLLVYGENHPQWLSKLRRLAKQNGKLLNARDRLMVRWHKLAGSAATALSWHEILYP